MHRWRNAAISTVFLAFSFIVSFVYADYLQMEPVAFWRCAIFVLLAGSCFLLRSQRTSAKERLGKRGTVGCCAYSCLFALSLVIGRHVHVEASYSGHIDVNYITPFGAKDLVAFCLLASGVFVLCLGLYALLSSGRPMHLICNTSEEERPSNHIHKGRIAVYALIMFLAWLPYLLSFWPGYIFSDTVFSLEQGIGNLNNHHPVAYTLFLNAGIFLGRKLGLGGTTGLALTTILQMAFMGFSLGYLAEWLRARLRIRPWLSYALVAVFACTPYVANFSIALWKDPIFTSSLVCISLMTMDLALSCGTSAQSPGWIAKYTLLLLVCVFSRNNGVYLVALLALGLGVLALAIRRHHATHTTNGIGRAFASTLGVVVAFSLVSGPGYALLGITQGSPAERYGIFLNQMARVAACNGNMSSADREYMNRLFPLDRYAQTYTPLLHRQS